MMFDDLVGLAVARFATRTRCRFAAYGFLAQVAIRMTIYLERTGCDLRIESGRFHAER